MVLGCLDENFCPRRKDGSEHNIGHEGCIDWAVRKEDIGDADDLEKGEYSVLLNGHDAWGGMYDWFVTEGPRDADVKS